MSTESTSQDPAAAEISTGPAARVKVGSKKFTLWILLAIFQLGLIFACIKLWIETRSNSDTNRAPVSEPPAPLPHHDSKRPRDAHRPAVDFRTAVARGDSLISEERYEPALAHFRQLIGQTDRYRESLVLYRAGLCSEQIGRSAEALEYYLQAGRLYPQSIVWDACQLGQARVLVRTEKWQEAKTLLWDLSLRSGDPRLAKRALFADASYLLGHVLSLEAMPSQPDPGLMTVRQSPVFVDWSIRQCTGWVAPDANTDNRAQDATDQQVAVRRTGKSPEDLLCSITAREVLVDDILHRLCAEAGIKVSWSDRARQQAQARRCTIVVTDMPLKQILSAATDFIGLVWSLRATELSLTVDADIIGDELVRYRRALAQQTLREAILAFPVHVLTPSAYLDLGNLEFAAKKFAEACPWYERLLQEAARSPAKLEALYNLGLARRAMNQPASARQAFYRVVDQQRGHELAALAYLQIGYAHLEDAEYEEAFRPLRRSVSLGNGTPVQPLATLGLAAGYLLAKNPRAARTVLGDARASLVDSRFRAMAIFFDSLACHRSVPPENPNKREATELLRSLWAVRQSDQLGSVGWLLMGQAYQELGLEDRMATLYQEVLPRTRGPVAFQMTRAVADFFFAGDEPLRAQPLFESLVEAGDPRWSSEACLRLAELALLQNRPRECLKWAERLSGDRSAKYYPKLLRLAGQAFEKLGDLDAAAKCFSGHWPEPEADR